MVGLRSATLIERRLEHLELLSRSASLEGGMGTICRIRSINSHFWRAHIYGMDIEVTRWLLYNVLGLTVRTVALIRARCEVFV